MLPAAALVLAGGLSSRFGADKALAPFRGEPLLAHVLRRLRDAGFRTIAVVAKEPAPYAALAGRARLVRDAHVASTPLAGLEAGLRACGEELAFACAVDMPFAGDPALLAALFDALAGHDAVVPRHGGAPQPLSALWRPATCLPVAARLLSGPSSPPGSRPPGPRALLDALDTRALDWPDALPFADADTPAALAALERAD